MRVLTAWKLGSWVRIPDVCPRLSVLCRAVLFRQRPSDVPTPSPRSPSKCRNTRFRNLRTDVLENALQTPQVQGRNSAPAQVP
jgi:hypothetical protein